MSNFFKFFLISISIHVSLFFGLGLFNNSFEKSKFKVQLTQGFQRIPIHLTDIELIELNNDISDFEKDDNKKDEQDILERTTKNKFSKGGFSKGVQSSLNEGIKNPEPEYPAVAVKWNWEGMVYLKIEVLKNGHVGSVKILKSSGYSILDDSAKDAVKRWRFPKSEKVHYKELEIEYKIKE